MEWYMRVLKKYADFNGRARRSEYWYFYLINFLITFGLGFLAGLAGGINPNSSAMMIPFVLTLLYSLVIFIPSLAVSVRRLHDINRSGWWLLIGMIPVIGAIVLIVFFVQDSQPGGNRYGPDPKAQGI